MRRDRARNRSGVGVMKRCLCLASLGALVLLTSSSSSHAIKEDMMMLPLDSSSSNALEVYTQHHHHGRDLWELSIVWDKFGHLFGHFFSGWGSKGSDCEEEEGVTEEMKARGRQPPHQPANYNGTELRHFFNGSMTERSSSTSAKWREAAAKDPAAPATKMRRKLRGNGGGEGGRGDVPAAAAPRFAKMSDELLNRLHSMRGGIAAAHHHHASEEEKLVMPSNSTTSGIEAALRENLGHHDNATDDDSLPKDSRQGVRVLKKGKKKMVQYGKSEEMEKHQHVWKLAEKEKEEEEVEEPDLHHPGRTRKEEKKEEASAAAAAAAAIADDGFVGEKHHMVVSTSSPTSSHFPALHLLKPELVGEAHEYSMKWSTVLREEDADDDKEEEKEDQHHVKEKGEKGKEEKEHRVEEKEEKKEHHHHVEEEGEKEKEDPHHRPHPLRPLGDEEGEKEKELHLHEVEKEEEQPHQPPPPPSSPHHPHEVEEGEKDKAEPHHRPHPHEVEGGEQEKEPHHPPHPPAHRRLGAATHHRHPYDGEEEEGEEGEEFERYYTRDNGQWNRLHHHRSPPSAPPRRLLNEQVAAMSRLLNMTAGETAHLRMAAREAAMDMIREEEAKVSRRNNNKEATAASPSASSSPRMDLTAVLKALAVTKPNLDGSSSTHRLTARGKLEQQYPWLKETDDDKKKKGLNSNIPAGKDLPPEAFSPPVANPLPFNRRQLQQGILTSGAATAGASSSSTNAAAVSTALAALGNTLTDQQKAEIRQAVYDTAVAMLKEAAREMVAEAGYGSPSGAASEKTNAAVDSVTTAMTNTRNRQQASSSSSPAGPNTGRGSSLLEAAREVARQSASAGRAPASYGPYPPVDPHHHHRALQGAVQTPSSSSPLPQRALREAMLRIPVPLIRDPNATSPNSTTLIHNEDAVAFIPLGVSTSSSTSNTDGSDALPVQGGGGRIRPIGPVISGVPTAIGQVYGSNIDPSSSSSAPIKRLSTYDPKFDGEMVKKMAAAAILERVQGGKGEEDVLLGKKADQDPFLRRVYQGYRHMDKQKEETEEEKGYQRMDKKEEKKEGQKEQQQQHHQRLLDSIPAALTSPSSSSPAQAAVQQQQQQQKSQPGGATAAASDSATATTKQGGGAAAAGGSSSTTTPSSGNAATTTDNGSHHPPPPPPSSQGGVGLAGAGPNGGNGVLDLDTIASLLEHSFVPPLSGGTPAGNGNGGGESKWNQGGGGGGGAKGLLNALTTKKEDGGGSKEGGNKEMKRGGGEARKEEEDSSSNKVAPPNMMERLAGAFYDRASSQLLSHAASNFEKMRGAVSGIIAEEGGEAAGGV